MIETTLCYPERDGKYLMMHRIKKKNDVNEGKWIGIGGKFLANEDPFECILRETKEETGLLLQNPRYCGIITFVNTKCETEQMHLFHATSWTGELSNDCREGNLEWISKEDLRKLPLWEGDFIFLDLMEKNCPFFSLKLEYDGDRLVNYHLHKTGKSIG